MAGRIIVPDLRAFDADGNPISGAQLFTYATGTTVDLATYKTAGATVAHENPVLADSAGRFPDVWAPEDTPYNIVVKDADGVVIHETDPVYALGAATNPAPAVINTPTTLTAGDVNKRIEVTAGPVTMPLGVDLTEGWRVRLIGRSATAVTIAYSGSDTGDLSALYENNIYEAVWTGTAFEFDYIGGGQGKQFVPIVATFMRPQTTTGAGLNIAELTTNKPMVATFDFDASTQEYAQFSFAMPKSWNEGTLTYRARWSHGATTVNFNVNWSLQAFAVSDGDALDAAWGTAVVVSDTGGATNTIYVTAESAAVTIAGTPQEGDTVYFRVSRPVSGVTGNLAVDAKLSAIDLFITTNAPTDQ